jgi:poly-gamma-glutamate synthesis protein (capsule biosynthesis protein)
VTKKIILLILFFLVGKVVLTEITPYGHAFKDIASPTTELKKEEQESLLYVGDVMLGRHVETLAKLYGADFSFKKVKPLLFTNTYVIANLEGPLPSHHVQTPSLGFRFNFTRDVANVLALYHISAVSLANNHTSDEGEEGYTSTVATLQSMNVASFGHSRFFIPNFVTHNIGSTTLSTIGINMITPTFDEVSTVRGVQSLCDKYGSSTSFIVFLHAGTEYTHKQSGEQVDFAHTLIDTTCVRTIIGSHPHVVQGVERYHGHLVFYSLGNFIFDQYFSKETEEGLTLRVTEEGEKLLFTLIPVHETESVPSVVDDDERDIILKTVADNSDDTLRANILHGKISE